jgi:hypothetical protein
VPTCSDLHLFNWNVFFSKVWQMLGAFLKGVHQAESSISPKTPKVGQSHQKILLKPVPLIPCQHGLIA